MAKNLLLAYPNTALRGHLQRAASAIQTIPQRNKPVDQGKNEFGKLA